MKKYIAIGTTTLLIFFISFSSNTFAHVVVKPAQVGIGSFQTFTMGVPSEKDLPTIQVRLLLPEGLEYVTPNVKPGWDVKVKKSTGSSTPTEISWTYGSIPAGQRDEFVFSAKVPASTTTLKWTAYQVYNDGSVVSWDQDANTQPKDADGKADFSKSGPYSQTKVIDDLTPKDGPVPWATLMSSIALVLSISALYLSHQRRLK